MPRDNFLVRHGELEIVSVEKVEGQKLPHKVLAEGEKLGNKHEVIGDADLYEKDGVLYLSANEEVEIIHPDHNTIKLPKGNYRIDVQREYVIGDDKYRKVVD
jgi:hypothetical protein